MNLGKVLKLVLAMVVGLGMAGCHHKQPAAPLTVPPPVQVPLVPSPGPATPPQVAQVPASPIPIPSKPVQKVKKPRRKVETVPSIPAQAPASPAPNQVATAAPAPDPSVIGALSVGGDSVRAEKHEAADLIAAVEKRLAELPAATKEAQRKGIAKVHGFIVKAKDALHSGDADGALTLATKAKVLLDDLLK